jgi:hypothetical protein
MQKDHLKMTMALTAQLSKDGRRSVEAVAKDWTWCGFDVKAAKKWWESGCFDALAAALLRSSGITPTQAAYPVPLEYAAGQATVGLALSRRAVRLEEAIEIIKGKGASK